MITYNELFALSIFAIILFANICIWYIVSSVCLYKLAGKAGLENKWMTFIPILNVLLFIRIIKWPDKSIIWYYAGLFISMLLICEGRLEGMRLSYILPIGMGIMLYALIIILSIVWYIQFLQAFGMSGLWILLLFVPYVNIIGTFALLIYMAFAKEVIYTIKDKPIMDFERYSKKKEEKEPAEEKSEAENSTK